jgi:vacuolar-type H+-ATPase subunit F/Vma7
MRQGLRSHHTNQNPVAELTRHRVGIVFTSQQSAESLPTRLALARLETNSPNLVLIPLVRAVRGAHIYSGTRGPYRWRYWL